MKYIIDWLENKTTSTGKQVKACTLKDETGAVYTGVSIWSDFPGWAELRSGGSVYGQIKTSAKGYKSLTAGHFPTRPPSGAVQASEITRESVREAQTKKNDSIAYFNSLNSAIALVGKIDGTAEIEEWKERLVYWRNWFLEEWQKYDSQDVSDKHKPF